MARGSRWEVGSNQYVKRPKAPRYPEPEVGLNLVGYTELDLVQYQADDVPFDRIKKSDTLRALARLQKSLPEQIWSDATLEGTTYTLPEVRTLLEGITVGGKSLLETQQILGLRAAYAELDTMLRQGTFSLSKETSDTLHQHIAAGEAIEVGAFRGEGQVGGGGHVRLTDGTIVSGVESDQTVSHHAQLLRQVSALEDPREQALAYFAAAVRAQYYFDGNKRVSRLMMIGHLISNGFDAANVPARKRLAFHQALDHLFADSDATALMQLVATSAVH